MVRVRLLVLGGVVGAVVALLAGGCDPAPKPAPPIKVSPSPSVDAKAKVQADYLAYWAALKAAHEASDPSYPDLKKHASGQGLTDAQMAIQSLRSVDMVLKGTPTHRIDVRSVNGTGAAVYDCLDTHGWEYLDRKTGKPHAPQPAKTVFGTTYQLTLKSGVWQVESGKGREKC